MKYTIDTSRVNDEAQRMNAIASQIMSASDTLNSIMASDGLRTDSGKRIMKSLMSVKKELEQNSKKTGKYAGTLSDIAKLYEKAENKASGNAEFKAKNKYTQAEKELIKFGKGAASFAAGMGIEMGKAALGPLVDVYDFATDSSDSDNQIDAIGDARNVIKDLDDFGKDVKKDGWMYATKQAFGLYKDDKTFKEAVLGDFVKVSDNCKTHDIVANWAGEIFDSAISNVKENGFSGRTVEETLVEAGLSVGKKVVVNAAATALVGAACGVIGVAGAPVIVTTVAAAGVGFALDKAGDFVAQKVTGDPKATWMEALSDGICDKGEEIGGLISNRVKGIVSTVGSNTQIQWTSALA